MIARRVVAATTLILLLVACGGSDSGDATATPTSPPAATVAATSAATTVPAATSAADTPSPTEAAAEPTATEVPPTEAPAQSDEVTVDAVIAAFTAAGLEAESPRPMTREDYGMAPYVGEGVRFLIPSLGEDSGGRVIQVPDDAERASLVTYYVDLGKSSALFYSHVFEHGDIVVQINGDLADDIAAQYEAALHTVGGD